MRLKPTIFLLAVLLLPLASATTISEKMFSDYGVGTYTVTGADHTGCVDVQFLRSAEDLDPRNHHVLSVRVEFGPSRRGVAKLEIYLNDEPLEELGTTDYTYEEGIVARVNLPRALMAEKNKLQLCATTSQSITYFNVLEDSVIGVYRMADFSHEDSFVKMVSTPSPTVNRPFTVAIVARNYGAGEADVHIDYRIVNMPRVELVEGETEFYGTIPGYDFERNIPGAATFTYTLFPKEEINMMLPRAIMSYTDIFGERVEVKSTQPDLFVQRIDNPVEGLIVVEKPFNAVGEEAGYKVVLKNNLGETLQNIAVYFEAEEGLSLDKEVSVIQNLEGQGSIELPLTARAEGAGMYRLGCRIVFRDENIESAPCPEESLYFESGKTDILLLGGALLAFVALLIYLFIYLKK